MTTIATTDLLVSLGYKLVEDASEQHGRLTYVSDENATRSFLKNLATVLSVEGWSLDPNQLRAFFNTRTGELIEIEPGGSDTTGHFLHLLIER